VAACYADRVVFLTDGRIAGRLERPSPQAVLEQMAALDRALGSD
jgi:putative ABC transport system ATP-binding protein